MFRFICKEKSMTISQFNFEYDIKHSTKSTPKRLRTINPLESKLSELQLATGTLHQPKLIENTTITQAVETLQKTVVLALCLGLFVTKRADAVSSPGVSIDILGKMLLDTLRKLGYWTCIVMCIYENVKSISEGDAQSIGKVSVKYVVGYLTLFVLPWVMDLIRDSFEGGM